MGFVDFLYALLALVFVLGLVGAMAVTARRFGFGYRTPGRGGRRRLSIVEAMPVDAKRRLVLLRRDATEHLVLLGTGSELLIESGIAPPPENFATALEETAARGGRERS